MIKLTPELKEKWVKVLRSGEYKQGKKKLRTVDGEFCCLGVLCDLLDPERWQAPDNDYLDWRYMGYEALLPTEVMNHMFMDGEEEDRIYGILDIVVRLAKRNDDGESFDEIADYIEENL